MKSTRCFLLKLNGRLCHASLRLQLNHPLRWESKSNWSKEGLTSRKAFFKKRFPPLRFLELCKFRFSRDSGCFRISNVMIDRLTAKRATKAMDFTPSQLARLVRFLLAPSRVMERPKECTWLMPRQRFRPIPVRSDCLTRSTLRYLPAGPPPHSPYSSRLRRSQGQGFAPTLGLA